jgi:hypothetical protein
MVPKSDLTETTYCLADKVKEFLIFHPGEKEEFTVNLSNATGTFAVEWLNVNKGTTMEGGPVIGGAVRTFTAPFESPAVLYLKAVDKL